MDLLPPKPSSSKKFPITILDGIRFEVEAEVAMEMEILKPLIEKDNNGEPSMIPLPNVSSDSLVKLIDYIRMHLDLIEKAKTCCDENQNRVSGYEKYGAFAEEAKIYDKEYLEKLDDDAIKELLLAVEYLDVKILRDFVAQGIADRIKNKSVEYLRGFFGVENDFTPEKEAMARAHQNEWFFPD